MLFQFEVYATRLVLFVPYFAFYNRLKRLFLPKEIKFDLLLKSGTAEAHCSSLFGPFHFQVGRLGPSHGDRFRRL